MLCQYVECNYAGCHYALVGLYAERICNEYPYSLWASLCCIISCIILLSVIMLSVVILNAILSVMKLIMTMLVSISPTFYEQLLPQKTFCQKNYKPKM